eukprot:1656209-Prorocentrum_lima.AAC.1
MSLDYKSFGDLLCKGEVGEDCWRVYYISTISNTENCGREMPQAGISSWSGSGPSPSEDVLSM